MPGFRRILAVAVLLVTSLVAIGPTAASPAGAIDDQVSLTLVIEYVYARDNLDTLDPADFYPEVDLAGSSLGGPSLEITDQDNINPNWTFTTSLPLTSAVATAAVTVSIYDADGAFNGPRDHVDLTAGDGRDVHLNVNLTDCALKTPGANPVTGDITGRCGAGLDSEGTSSDKAAIRIRITANAPDSDGDGLLDAWEFRGYDADGNGSPDVDLPAMGARADHKDLFLELDASAASTLGREDVLAMKKAFAAAPLDAGTNASRLPGGVDAKPNPDGRPGITLHVDTGTIVDRFAREGQPLDTCANGIDDGGDGRADAADPDCIAGGEFLDASTEDPGSPNCTDGADNDGDGLADANDPDCLLGDDLGGGNLVVPPAEAVCALGAPFYTIKAANFAPARARIFRYAVSMPLGAGCAGSGGNGEVGGNDFVEFNFDGGTVMHEFGHNLNLSHGGADGSNCKPNYVSIMNYDNQSGIRRVGGGAILDYSPPRRATSGSSRSIVPADIVESALDETVLLDGGDAVSRFVYTDAAGNKRSTGLNTNPNYNNDTDPPLDSGFAGNVDTSDGAGDPAACTNGSTSSTLVSQNDWLRISLPFQQFGNSASGPVNPVSGPELTAGQLVALESSINAADLSVSVAGPVGDVVAGTSATYRTTATNRGPNAAPGTTVTVELPAGTSYESDNGGCATLSPSTLRCDLGELPPGAQRSIDVTAGIRPGLVYDSGSPVTVTWTASIAAVRGSDPNPSDNRATASSRVVAESDLAVSASIVGPPTEIVIGETRELTVRSVTSSAGPSAPMDVRLRTAADATTAGRVDVTQPSTLLVAVGPAAPRVASTTFTLSCSVPGEHTFTLRTSVAPNRIDDRDPDPSNNVAVNTVVVDCIVPVAINIKPKGDTNPIQLNLGSDIPIAILSTEAGEYRLPLAFDATRIIATTVHAGPRAVVDSGGGGAETHGINHLERSWELDNRTRDRDLDDIAHFQPIETGLVVGDDTLCVKGKFLGPAGQPWTFLGCGRVRVLP